MLEGLANQLKNQTESIEFISLLYIDPKTKKMITVQKYCLKK